MSQLRTKVLIVAGMTAMNDALRLYPNARVITAEAPRHEEPLFDFKKLEAAASDQPPSRGPAPRRKYPVRR